MRIAELSKRSGVPLPWGVCIEDNADVRAARAVLDADHYGLDEVKDRLIEFLAVRARRAEPGTAGPRWTRCRRESLVATNPMRERPRAQAQPGH